MRKNVLFVYPEFSSTFWSWKFLLSFVNKKAAFIPLTLLTVAAMFPQDWPKKLVDLNVRSHIGFWQSILNWFAGFLGAKRKCGAELVTDEELEWADVVVITALNAQKISAQEIALRCKALGKECVALGGPVLEIEPMCEEFPGVQHFFFGKGEKTVPQFINDLQQGNEQRVYRQSVEPGKMPNINDSPIPLFELCNLEDYATAGVQTSWGCPYTCTYCKNRSLEGNKCQQKSPERVVAELNRLYDLGWRGGIQDFSDNTFGNFPVAKELMKAIAAWQEAHGHPFEFTVEAAITIASDEELMRLMVRAGIKKVFLGLETNNEASLREYKKRQNIGVNLEEAVRKIRQAGLIPMSGYIVGADSDPPDTFADDTISFVQSTCTIAMVDTLQAQHGTSLFDQMWDEDRFERVCVSNTDFLPNFVPKMDKRVLARGFAKILKTIWSAPRYYERIRRFLDDYGVENRPLKALSKRDLAAFRRACVWIGLFGFLHSPLVSYYFWKSLLETFFSKKRRAFPDVVAFWIFGTHLRRATMQEVKKAEAWLASQVV